MALCRRCGTNNLDNARFCRKCGAPLAPSDSNPYIQPPIQPQNTMGPKPGVCPNCGRPVRPDETICMACGAKLTQQPPNPYGQVPQSPAPTAFQGPVCPHCGRPAEPGIQFCRYCGAPIQQGNIPNPYQMQQPPKKKKKKSSFTLPLQITAGVLAVVLLVTGFWKPGFILNWFRGDEIVAEGSGLIEDGEEGVSEEYSIAFQNPEELKPEKTENFSVDGNDPVVNTENGISIDFGPLNEIDGQTLKVDTFKPVEDKDFTQILVQADMGDHHEFAEPFDVAVPVNLSDAATDDDGDALVWAERYSPELGMWYPVWSEVDAEKGQVVIHSNHLSPAWRVVSCKNKDNVYALLARPGKKPAISPEAAKKVLESLEQGDQKSAVGLTKLLFMASTFGVKFSNEFNTMILDQDFDAEAIMNTMQTMGSVKDAYYERGMDTVGWFAGVVETVDGIYNPATVLDTAGGTALGSIAKNISSACTYLSAASIVYDIATHMDDPEYISGKWADVAKWTFSTAMGSNITACAAESIGGTLLSCSMMGIMAIDWSLNALFEEGQKLHRHELFNVMCYYYDSFNETVNGVSYANEDHNWFNPKSGKHKGCCKWDEVVLAAYVNSRDDKEFKEKMQAWIDSYTNDFFQLDYEVLTTMWSDMGSNAGTTRPKVITEGDKKALKEQYSRHLAVQLEPCLKRVMKAIQCDIMTQQGLAQATINKNMMEKVTFKVIPPEKKEKEYANAVFSLVNEKEEYNKAMASKLEKDGSKVIRSTLRHYAQNGIPQKCAVWKKGNSPLKKKPDLVVSFTFDPENGTVIDLGQGQEQDNEVAKGTWKKTNVTYLKPPSNTYSVEQEWKYHKYDWSPKLFTDTPGYKLDWTYNFLENGFEVKGNVSEFTGEDIAIKEKTRLGASGTFTSTAEPLKDSYAFGEEAVVPVMLEEKRDKLFIYSPTPGYVYLGYDEERSKDKMLKDQSYKGFHGGYTEYGDMTDGKLSGTGKLTFPENHDSNGKSFKAGEKIYIAVLFKTGIPDGQGKDSNYNDSTYYYKIVYEYTAQ